MDSPAVANLAIASLLLIALAAGKGEIQSQLHDFNQQQAIETAHQTAQRRYTDGCIVVKSFATGKHATLLEGQPVYDPSNASVFPAGVLVCDVFGNTAILQNRPIRFDWQSPAGFQYDRGDVLPLVSDIAYTGSPPSPIDEERYGYLGRTSSVGGSPP